MHSIVMCTAASNEHGWVSFLKQVLEVWFKASVYDLVIHAEDLKEWHAKNRSVAIGADGIFVKDMNMVREKLGLPPEFPVVIVDDRPSGVRNGMCLSVPEFKIAVDIVGLVGGGLCGLPGLCASALRSLDEHSLKVLSSMWQSYKDNPASMSDWNTDRALLEVEFWLRDAIWPRV